MEEAINSISFELERYDSFEEHLFKKLNEKRAKKGKGPVGKKLADKIKKVGDKLGVDKALTLPLLPFKKAMKKKLSKIGKKAKSDKIDDVADAFFNFVIKPKIPGNLEENIEPATMTVIITAIVKFFKQLKEKKEAGQTDSDENELIDDADTGVEEISEMSEEEIESAQKKGQTTVFSQTTTDKSSDAAGDEKKGLFMILAVVLVLYFLNK